MSITYNTQEHSIKTVSKAHVLSGLQGLVSTVFTWAERIRTRRELRELLDREDRIFQDIGQHRNEIEYQAFKPFWKA